MSSFDYFFALQHFFILTIDQLHSHIF